MTKTACAALVGALLLPAAALAAPFKAPPRPAALTWETSALTSPTCACSVSYAQPRPDWMPAPIAPVRTYEMGPIYLGIGF